MVSEKVLSEGVLSIQERLDGDSGCLRASLSHESLSFPIEVIVKDAANRESFSGRDCIPEGTDLAREYATYLFAREFPGLARVPTMVFRQVETEWLGATVTRECLVMEQVNGVHGIRGIGWLGVSGEIPKGVSLTEKRGLALFDAIVGNTDRHWKNYFVRMNSVTRKREVIAIDHGLCWPNPEHSNGYIDAVNTDFLRHEALPKYGISWLYRIRGKQAKVYRMLQPFIETAALDAAFSRIDRMLKTGYFLNQSELSRS